MQVMYACQNTHQIRREAISSELSDTVLGRFSLLLASYTRLNNRQDQVKTNTLKAEAVEGEKGQ